MGTDNTPRGRVVEVVASLGADRLAEVVVDALAFTGAQAEWRGETVDGIVAPFFELLDELGLPWVGSSDSAEFWGPIHEEES